MPDGVAGTNTEVTALSIFGPHTFAYYDEAGTDNSRTLRRDTCPVVSFCLNSDEDGTATGGEVQIWQCEEEQTGSISTTQCSKVLADTNGDGVVDDVTLVGPDVDDMRSCVTLVGGKPYVAAEVTLNGSSDDLRVTTVCYAGS